MRLLVILAFLQFVFANPFILPSPANGFLTLELGSGIALSLATWKGPRISIDRLASQEVTIFSSRADLITAFKTDHSGDETTVLLRHAHMKFICETSGWQHSYITVTMYDDKFILFDQDYCRQDQATQHDLEILQAAYNCVR